MSAFQVLKNHSPFFCELAVHAAHRLAERDGLLDRLVGERRAAGPVHHRGRDVVRDDDRIERRRRRVQHERLVEARVRDRAASVADVQERGLRQRGQQLVRRVRREDRRTLVILRIAVHRVAVAIERVEARVRVPRLVEVDAIDARVEQLLDAARVVAQAVVGRVGDDRVAPARVLDALRDERVVP